MELKRDWLVDGLMDFEYKKYILLSYFKSVSRQFDRVELYPILGELVDHYRTLKLLKEEKTMLKNSFPNSITGIDLKNLELRYEEMVRDDELMSELEAIMDYALPLFRKALDEGKEIYEFVESKCEIHPVGLVPLYTREGYLLIRSSGLKKFPLFRYEVSVFQRDDEKLHGIQLKYMDSFPIGPGNTVENLKVRLIRKFSELPNPAMFLVNAELQFPMKSTLLPVVKRLIFKQVA